MNSVFRFILILISHSAGEAACSFVYLSETMSL